ncbi:MAG: DUF2723 domain-containing protein [Candidatus Eremiobacteraeota bacterium]|nr:DUF2723 domain-containing protein [Candidatus Eremiobacteraeota bacterium]
MHPFDKLRAGGFQKLSTPLSSAQLLGIVAFVAPFATYTYSMQRAVGYWDVGEMQTVPYILGIAHPTGFPAFVLAGWIFTHLFAIGSVAWRVTLLCACAMALTAWLIYRIVVDETRDAAVALIAALSFAFTGLAWVRGTRAEVHAMALTFVALTLWCVLRWSATLDRRWLYGSAAAWACGIATHPIAALAGIGLLIVLVSRWESIATVQLLKALALGIIIVGAFYAYLPIRSAQVTAQGRDPTLALGVAPGRPFWDYDHPANRSGFVALVSGSEFPVGAGIAAIFLPETYVHHGLRYMRTIVDNFTFAGLGLIVAGAIFFIRSQRLRAIGFIIAGMTAVPFALGYPPEADVERYFLISFVASAVLIGIALKEPIVRWPRFRVAVLAAGALLVAAQWYVHRDLLGQRFDPGASRYLAYIRSHTESNAIIVAPWAYATPLAYAAYVERDLGNRIVDAAWLSDDVDLIPRWIVRRPVYVVYLPWGDPPSGYRLKLIRREAPALYRIVKRS